MIKPTTSAWLTISNWLTKRIWRKPVCLKSSMAARAKCASRLEWENSFTVVMLV
ncbi:hypothetical protein D3C71_2159190 [compost metagenome]